jgi:peptidoglycan/LPS O-acetylase OafA/YrhL
MIRDTLKPASSSRFVELDSVRALAALWVFSYHVWQFGGSPALTCSIAGSTTDLFWLVHHGPVGVDIFMVLSGFCLFWPLTKQPFVFEWKQYALRRIQRILPAYYAAIAYAILIPVALVLIVRMVGWEANSQPVPSLRQVIFHLLFIHTLFSDTWNGITGAFWSMGLEAQFYVVFPFLVWAWKRIGVRAIGYAALASVFFRVVVSLLQSNADSIESFLLSITFLGRWMQFAAGMGAALWVRHTLGGTPPKITPIQWMTLAAISGAIEILGLVAPSITEGPIPLRDILLATGSAGLLATLCTAPSWLKIPLIRGPLPYMGKISYSFFLIHQPTAWYAMEFFRKKLGFSGTHLVFLGCTAGLVISALCASVFYQLFERPFLNVPDASRHLPKVSPRQTQSVA